MDKNVIIYQPWGGLGDNLAHSTLPEQCHKHGIRCLLSRQNAYRNNGIKEFVWANNPYIEGEIDSTDLSWFKNISQYEKIGMNHLEAIQKYYGFNNTFHYPKIYYTPKDRPEFFNKTIVDLTAHTTITWYNLDKIRSIIKKYDLDTNTLLVTHSNIKYERVFDFMDKFSNIDITDLYTYSDILASCKRFLTLHSGQATLASTIKNITNNNTEITVIAPGIVMPDRSVNYWYKNTIYIQGD